MEIPLSTAVAPAWWDVWIAPSGSTQPVRVERLVPLGPSDSFTWDGRDAAGRIVDNGAWDLVLTPVDGQGNGGAGCQVTAVVANALGTLPP